MRVAFLARAGIGGILRRKKNKNIKSKKIATVAFADIQSLADNARTVVCKQPRELVPLVSRFLTGVLLVAGENGGEVRKRQ